MTFYWWSHWFWITALPNVLIIFTLTSTAHTFPSQEIMPSQQLSEIQKPITKLYQEIKTTQSLETTMSTNNLREEYSTGITKLQSITDHTPSPIAILNRKEYGSSNTGKNVVTKDAGFLENFEEQYEDEASYVAVEEELITPVESKRSADDVNQIKNQNISLSTSQKTNNETDMRNMEKQTETVRNFTNFSNVETTTINARNMSSIEKLNSTTLNNYTDANVKLTNLSQLSLDTQRENNKNEPINNNNNNTACQEKNVQCEKGRLAPKVAAEANFNGEVNDSTGAENSITVAIQRVPFTLENANKLEELRIAENEHRARKSKVLSADYQHNARMDSKNLLTRSASTAPNELDGPRRKLADEGNISSEALAIKRTYFLDAGTISAICLTIFGICCTIGTAGIVLYRRRYLNKPQTLSEPDSSVYIDDSTMRISDNSDEMYSLDNDSFLNSLEAMTIQNYWTDTVKHTKL